MFGYIRPVRPDMLVGDDELYGAVYCGLCRYSGRHVTHASRFLLNYDFAFLAVLRASLTNEEIRTERVRCPYKFRKRSSAVCDGAFASAAGYFGILTYYKLLDDLNDERGWKKFGKKFLLPLAVLPAGLTAVFQGIEEGARAQVFLQIAALIGGDGQHLRHREALLMEMMGEGDEGVVLLHGGADDTDDGVPGC